MIEVNSLSFVYSRDPVLTDISIRFKAGVVSGIFGPNGCGKSTLIKLILGLDRLQKGSIKVLGQTILDTHEYRKKIGYMAQQPLLPESLTVNEFFKLNQDIRKEKASRLKEMTELFGVEKFRKKRISELSGGMKQRVSVVAAWMFDPEILILDEPTVALDPVACSTMKTHIRNSANEGKTILLVSHILQEVEDLVTEILVLHEGKAIFQGAVSSLQNKGGMELALISMLKEGS